ncbi:MAG TPA: FimV/HubP family polar landmark protein, partial [Dokdonella sp.]|nr:FimV/HubP family polar landmark protein [Dokdonella sp.]
TVLLDPPVTAPARSAPAAVAASPAAPVSKPAAPRRDPEKVVAAEKPAAPAPARERPVSPAGEPRKVLEGEYGPVKEGETLSGIARAARPDGSSANLDQMMLALLKNNPNAFDKDNINALKRGAILRIPSADEAKAIGSASEAAAQVRAQFEDWRGGRATPTRVASTTEAPAVAAPKEPKESKPAKAATAGTEAKSPSERLELVPPKSGKGSLAMADQPGTGSGSAAAAEAKRELARTKEALTAREQEASELKSRVKELEDLKGKNDRLISLKDSEIADLQQKLKELQAKADAAAKAAGKPATAATATPPPPVAAATPPATTAKETAIDKKDIWGDAGKATTPASEATKAASPATAPPTATPPAPGSTTTATAPAATSPASGTTAPATTPGMSATGPSATPSPTATPSPSTEATTTTPPATTSPSASSTSTGATVTPLPATPPTQVTSGTAAKPSPATTVKKPAPAPAPQPAWYDAPWVKPAALGGGVLLVLLGLFGMRKRNAAPAAAGGTRPSIADAFGESPVGGGATSDVMEAEAAALREQIAREPGNVGLYLELLSLYYAERDVAKFEDTAAQMHAYVTDPSQPEWQEAQAMGQELAPHNPLFAPADAYDAGAAFADTAERPVLDTDDFGFDHAHVPATPQPAMGAHADMDDYGFGLAEAPVPTPAPAPTHTPPPPAADAFTFDDLPPLEAPVARATPAPAMPAAKEPAPAMKEASLDDDFFAGEDAVGTKLDLAKAYMDMGDPDGARSMLEEVVAEGNDVQKAEAHRLISELR